MKSWDTNSADKIQSKYDKEIKVSLLMPIRVNLSFLDYLFVEMEIHSSFDQIFFSNFDQPVKLFSSSSFSLPRKKVVWCKWRCSIIWKTSFARARLLEAQTSFLSNARKWKKNGKQAQYKYVRTVSFSYQCSGSFI